MPFENWLSPKNRTIAVLIPGNTDALCVPGSLTGTLAPCRLNVNLTTLKVHIRIFRRKVTGITGEAADELFVSVSVSGTVFSSFYWLLLHITSLVKSVVVPLPIAVRMGFPP